MKPTGYSYETDHVVPAPPPASDDFASMDARIRVKLSLGQRLTYDEKLFFTRIPGANDVTPTELRDRELQ